MTFSTKYEWHKYGERPTKFFLNLEKLKAINATIRQLIDDEKDITALKEINVCICKVYKNLFKKKCESEITEKDLISALKSMPNSKSPRHVGLTKEFYEHSWDDLKFYFINSLKQSKLVITSLFLKDKQL